MEVLSFQVMLYPNEKGRGVDPIQCKGYEGIGVVDATRYSDSKSSSFGYSISICRVEEEHLFPVCAVFAGAAKTKLQWPIG